MGIVQFNDQCREIVGPASRKDLFSKGFSPFPRSGTLEENVSGLLRGDDVEKTIAGNHKKPIFRSKSPLSHRGNSHHPDGTEVAVAEAPSRHETPETSDHISPFDLSSCHDDP